MNETNISPRHRRIVTIISQGQGYSRGELERLLVKDYPLSKPTLVRDLNSLITQKYIRAEGKGRNTKYYSLSNNPLLYYIDLDTYFLVDPDKRQNVKKNFNFNVFKYLINLFGKEDFAELNKIYKSFSQETKKLNKDIYIKELERFIIELSWKSSKIEGNTYSLLETETLIKQSIEAQGHPKEEAVMILNHKKAFVTILAKSKDYQKITLAKVFQLHNFIVKDLNISAGIRKQPVGITGTAYVPLDNQWQIQETLEKLVRIINKLTHPLEKALVANVMISYIQPFSDGNKRTGRMLANAILLAHDFYPLSYRSVDETTYKKALIIFYEQNSLYHLKKIFIEQYQFALNTYFKTLYINVSG